MEEKEIPAGATNQPSVAVGKRSVLDPQAFYLAEYTSLRDEIIQRISIANNIQSLALVLAGALIGAGLQPGITASVYLVYPILAFFLALGWLHNDRKRFHIAEYIRTTEKESRLSGWGLRHLQIRKQPGFTALLERASSLGLFLGSSFLMTTLGLLKTEFGLVEWILFAFDLLSLLGLACLWFAAKAW